MAKRKGKRSSGSRAALIVLCVVLGVILTVLVGATAYAQHLLNRINYVKPGEQETMSPEEIEAYLATEERDYDSTAPTITDDEIDWGENEVEIGNEDHIVNILLVGQDARPGEKRTRSDVMILVTFNTKTGNITMTSFLRDLYVQIPGYRNSRLNTAYAWGGMDLLSATLYHNFGIVVDGIVEVNFQQFAGIIDILGGVDIELRNDEANYINKSLGYNGLSGGMQHLNGEQALVYARIRKLDANGDFSRTNRQRKVLNALFEEFKNSDLSTLLNLLEEIMPLITTNMSQSEIIGYATELFPILSGAEMVSQRIPADGAYDLRMIDGMSVVVADMDKARQLLQDTLAG